MSVRVVRIGDGSNVQTLLGGIVLHVWYINVTVVAKIRKSNRTACGGHIDYFPALGPDLGHTLTNDTASTAFVRGSSDDFVLAY
jgi:hypothetical protein